jgi:Xaa-Pro aminopeptidase
MKPANLLMVADSVHDADMLYAVQAFVPDPIVYTRLRGEEIILVNDLELDRLHRQARHCRVRSLGRLEEQPRNGSGSPSLAHRIRALLREHRVRKVAVATHFPYGLARQLRRLKVKLKVEEGPVFPQRAIKTAAEVKRISAALTMAEVGLAEALQMLRCSRVDRNRRLVHHGVPLTSEKVQSTINIAVMQAGGTATHTIVAGGRQACDPHEFGHGVLRANEPIVIDVFPRSQKTGYFGDITRTVVKGRASEGVRRAYHAVVRAQDLAFRSLRGGLSGQTIHRQVAAFFEREGFPTRRQQGRLEGFVHGTGHGVGLEVHEAPRLGSSSRDTLREGNVVTLEPGLYYRELGGIRLEDVAWLGATGAKNLTRFEKVLEL